MAMLYCELRYYEVEVLGYVLYIQICNRMTNKIGF